MAEYYIESDGNGGTTGGDGSIGSPCGTLAELDAAVTLSDGDTVYCDTETNGPLLESWSRTGLTGITFSPKPGTTQVRQLNALKIAVDIVHDASGADPFDSYKALTGVPASKPNEVVEDWDTRINSDGNRYGFLPEVGTLAGLRTTRGWHYNGSRLLVSVPAGDTGGAHTYYAGQDGDCMALTNTTRVTFNNWSFELATEPGAGNGYGCRMVGTVQDVVFNDPEGDGCQYHSIGAAGSSCDGFVCNRPIFRTAIAGNDSHWVAYSSSGSIQNTKVNDPMFYLVPWLRYDNTPYSTGGSVKGIACHHGVSADPTAIGGLIVTGYRSIYNNDNPTYAHWDLVLAANNMNHPAPADKGVPADYPIQFIDGSLNGHGFAAGGGSNSDVHASFDRCAFDIDASSVTNGMSTAGHLSVTANATNANTIVLLRSCTGSVTLNDVNDRAILTARVNGAELRMENSTFLLLGTYSNNVCIVHTGATAGMLKSHGCSYSTPGGSISLIRGSIDLATAIDFDSNFYSTSISTISAIGSVSRATWESTYDTNGEYSASASFLDTATLEPDADTRAFKSTTKTTGPLGINLVIYDGSYGAYQYGTTSVYTRRRGRGRDRGVVGGYLPSRLVRN